MRKIHYRVAITHLVESLQRARCLRVREVQRILGPSEVPKQNLLPGTPVCRLQVTKQLAHQSRRQDNWRFAVPGSRVFAFQLEEALSSAVSVFFQAGLMGRKAVFV